jgi:hypothetical protein
MDAVHYLVVLHYEADAAMFGVIGLVAVLLLERSWPDRLKGLACAAALAAVTALLVDGVELVMNSVA